MWEGPITAASIRAQLRVSPLVAPLSALHRQFVSRCALQREIVIFADNISPFSYYHNRNAFEVAIQEAILMEAERSSQQKLI